MAEGLNYGLNNSLEYTEFEFDSFDCKQAYNSDYKITDWPNFYLGKPLDNVAALKVLEAQIPYTFYLFNSKNNTFQLEEFTDGGTTPSAIVDIVLEPGNYTAVTIVTALNDALNAASPNGFSYSTVFKAPQLKLAISNNDIEADNYFSLKFGDVNDAGATNPRIWLGFGAGDNISTINTGSANSSIVTAPNVIQLTGPNYVYICSRRFGSLIHLYLPGNGVVNPVDAGADGPQIAKIAMTSGVGTVCDWQDPDPQKWFDTGNSIIAGNIDFYVTIGTAGYDVPVEFNGASFSLKLGILTSTSNHSNYLGGGSQNNRAVTRTFPTGTQPFGF